MIRLNGLRDYSKLITGTTDLLLEHVGNQVPGRNSACCFYPEYILSPQVLLARPLEAVAAAAKAYRVSFSKFQNQDGGKDYTIDHTALAYLMGTDGEYIAHIPYGTSVAQMVDILNRYL